MQKIKIKQEWSQEEKIMLTDLFPRYSSKKWKMISLKMAQHGFKRTQLQCRQKWINFLDPNLNNQEWSQLELEKMYRLHDQYGTRWCYMQQELNRTQNRIKNRFYGTIRNYIRMILNTLCERNSCYNAQISKISPSLLNDLYNSQNIFDFLKSQIKKMIYRMKFQIDKKVLRNRIRQKEQLYRELLSIIGGLFQRSVSLKYLEKIERTVDEPKRKINKMTEIKIEQKRNQLFQESFSINKITPSNILKCEHQSKVSADIISKTKWETCSIKQVNVDNAASQKKILICKQIKRQDSYAPSQNEYNEDKQSPAIISQGRHEKPTNLQNNNYNILPFITSASTNLQNQYEMIIRTIAQNRLIQQSYLRQRYGQEIINNGFYF